MESDVVMKLSFKILDSEIQSQQPYEMQTALCLLL